MIAFHGIFGAYGFWLPNDPRGSWSSWVGSWELYRYGPATKTTATHSLAHYPHNRKQRLAAKQAMKYPPVSFTGEQARVVGDGFRNAIEDRGLHCYACAILPDHVHVVMAAHRLSPGQVIGDLKRLSGDALVRASCHPLQAFSAKGQRPPLCFVRRGWKVYLDTVEDVARCIKYVENNPLKEGLPKQKWSFVEAFSG